MHEDNYIIPMTLELVNANIEAVVEMKPEIEAQIHLTYDGYEPHSAIAGIAIAGKAIAGYIWS